MNQNIHKIIETPNIINFKTFSYLGLLRWIRMTDAQKKNQPAKR